MGDNFTVKAMRPWVQVLFLCLIFAAVLAITGCADETKHGEEVTPLDAVERQIEKFRAGEEFNDGIRIYLSEGKLDQKVLQRLARALRTEDQHVRVQVARVLAAVGQETDSLYPDCTSLMRNRDILAVLVKDGLAQPGDVRSFCLYVLQSFVPPELLKEFGQRLADNVREYPSPTALLVIAKGKIFEARGLVDSLMLEPHWARQAETAIAKAALGDTKIEEEFVKKFIETNDPEAKARLAEQLGFIGTKGALRALASEMRTDLYIENPGVWTRSVRVDIVAALKYNYPDKPFLWDNAVLDDSGYERIEKFCEKEFGVEWTRPRPEFLWIEGY